MRQHICCIYNHVVFMCHQCLYIWCIYGAWPKKTARCSPCEGLPSGPSENVFAPNTQWLGGRTNCWTESRTGAHTLAYVLQASLSLYWQGGSQRCCCGCPACCCCGSLHGSWSGRCSTACPEDGREPAADHPVGAFAGCPLDCMHPNIGPKYRRFTLLIHPPGLGEAQHL
jgi:hypothetical protein